MWAQASSRLASPTSRRPGLVDELGHARRVGDADEVVRLLHERREAPRPRLRRAGLGDVAHGADEAYGLAVPEDGVALGGEHPLDAVAQPDHAVLGVEAFDRADGGLDRTVRPLTVVRVQARQEGALVGDRVVREQAEERPGACVPGQRAGDEVVVVDAGPGTLQRQPEAVLGLAQGGLGALALGDVGDHDEEAVHRPAGGPARM